MRLPLCLPSLVLLVLLATAHADLYNGIEVYLTPSPEKMVAWVNGEIAHVLKVSTGRPGHPTPIGHLQVIAKNATAVSSKYHSPMQFALRLAESPGGYTGINIHQEIVPDYPASHGCVRTHFKSAIIMFTTFDVKTPVYIYEGPAPANLSYTEDYSTGNFTRDYFVVGDQDGAVPVVQSQLVRLGLLDEADVTGVYDEVTRDAVAKYQQTQGLPVDGLAGDVTMQYMLSYLDVGF